MKRAVVAATNYEGTGFELAGCVNDGRDWTDFLQLREWQVSTMLGASASRDSILAVLTETVGRSKPGDRLALVVSGHGTQAHDVSGDETDRTDEAICPDDVQTAGPILDDDIRAIMRARPWGVRAVMVMDTCYSGGMARFVAGEPEWIGESYIPRSRLVRVPKFLPARLAAPAVRAAKPKVRLSSDPLVLSGCAEGEFSFDAVLDGRPCGAFSYHALRSLRMGAKTYRDVHTDVRLSLPSATYPQSPQQIGSYYARTRPAFG